MLVSMKKKKFKNPKPIKKKLGTLSKNLSYVRMIKKNLKTTYKMKGKKTAPHIFWYWSYKYQQQKAYLSVV